MTYMNSGKYKSNIPLLFWRTVKKAKVSVCIKSNIDSYKGTSIGRFLFGRQRREEL
jgi:hypothetical protein